METKIQLLNPVAGKSMPRITQEKYDLVRDAILQAVASTPDGILFGDLPAQVSQLLSRQERESLGSVSWYTISVKLDLEARGLIERLPGARPQRLRLTKS
jgi:hypothetical protein